MHAVTPDTHECCTSLREHLGHVDSSVIATHAWHGNAAGEI